MPDPKTSRGYRNKNPGNLNYIADPQRAWRGQIGMGDSWMDPSKRRFGEYDTHANGIRAIAGQLVVNQTRRGLSTIAAQIGSWAPPSDNNNTDAYVRRVATAVGVTPTARVDVRSYSVMRPLVAAIIDMECAGQPYADAEIDEGLALYGITPHSEQRVATMAQAAQTGTGAASINVATLTGAAGVAAPILTSLGGWPWQATVALVVAAAIGVVAWTLSQRKTA